MTHARRAGAEDGKSIEAFSRSLFFTFRTHLGKNAMSFLVSGAMRQLA